MPQTVPNGWDEDSSLSNQLPNTPSGEVPIKSELTYKGEKYALITNSVGEYKVYLGGTGIFNQQIGESALIFSSNPSGKKETETAWQKENTRRLIGGNAGLLQLNALAQKQTSEGLKKYLTSEELNKLQNQPLKSSITNVESSPPEQETPRTLETQENEAVITESFDITDLSENFKALNFNNIKEFFTYPLDINNDQDRITFSQYKYVATKLDGDVNSIIENFANRNNTLKKTKLQGTVVLPVPNQITESNQTGWGESQLSTIGAVLMKGFSSGALDIADAKIMSAAGKLGSTVAGLLGSGAVQTRAQSFLAAKIASQVISKIGVSVDPEQYLARVSGGVINPNLELLFNGPKLRPFAFSFKMSPTSEEEARNIRAIIKFFKAGMAPQRSRNNEVALFLGSPNVFEVQFESRSKSLDGLPRIKMCALQSCAVNYAPDGAYAAYEDSKVGSQPVAIEMQLQFIELTPVFADEYNLEDQNVPIGPDVSTEFKLNPGEEQ